MKNYKVEILPIAQKDIAETLNYIAIDLCNPTAALKLHSVISECFKRLKCTPLCGSKLEIETPLKYNYRWLMAENYIIFYTVNEPNETVYIMRMLFSSSDYVSELLNSGKD